MVRLLAIDDDRQSLDLISSALEQDGLEILTAEDPEKGLQLLRSLRPQIVLVDLMMPEMTGLEFLEHAMEADPSTDVILMTAHYSTESAVEAIQKGACDYLNKPIALDRLQERIARLVEEAEAQRKAQALEAELTHACNFQGIIGRSPLMLDVFAKIRRVGPHFRNVLVSGATGTGKELVARALHSLSPAAKGPFVACNCAALAEALVESELFGYVRGAFTGANQDRTGLFEFAHGGTLFLDEIGEMPLAAQAKLLRAVQNQEVQRVGSPSVRKVNVRIVAATNRDLRAAVAEKEFRSDLFFRLSMVELKVPTLAERREDLPLLIRHFIEQFSREYGKNITGLTRRAGTALYRYPWPGNIRELENAIGSACMMAQSSSVDIQDLPEFIRSPAGCADAPSHHPLISSDEMQKLHARKVLELVGDDKIKAAEILQVSRATLYRMLTP
ncbi:MAG: Regulatory protein AtoC [Bryobacteraceae bacterium]|nr:Regulatory protein AtoC [Bryobacteraceae bacterium]